MHIYIYVCVCYYIIYFHSNVPKSCVFCQCLSQSSILRMMLEPKHLAYIKSCDGDSHRDIYLDSINASLSLIRGSLVLENDIPSLYPHQVFDDD